MIFDPSQLSKKGELRIKALTAGVTSALLVVLVLTDWDSIIGHPNLFSGVRPVVRGFFNRVYGVDHSKDREPKREVASSSGR